MTSAIVCGDALEVLRDLPDGLFHCCATSPPYWALRDYGVTGQLGLEDTPQQYVAKLVEVCREVRRVLRDDGVFWLNLGDCYAAGGRGGDSGSSGLEGSTASQDSSKSALVSFRRDRALVGGVKHKRVGGLKPKDLVGIPWRVAFALQEDGWYLRADVIWHKPNPMPESTRGRPTKSHEYVFMLTKRARYHFDDEALAEPCTDEKAEAGTMRHVRSVWTIATTPFKQAHFAVMTRELAHRLVRSATSAQGCCSDCGAPWYRMLRRTKAVIRLSGRAHDQREAGRNTTCHGTMLEAPKMETLGWAASCKCTPMKQVPCRVLDPFCGAGTTGLAALEAGADFIGIELNPVNVEMAQQRLAEAAT